MVEYSQFLLKATHLLNKCQAMGKDATSDTGQLNTNSLLTVTILRNIYIICMCSLDTEIIRLKKKHRTKCMQWAGLKWFLLSSNRSCLDRRVTLFQVHTMYYSLHLSLNLHSNGSRAYGIMIVINWSSVSILWFYGQGKLHWITECVHPRSWGGATACLTGNIIFLF
jgi:hypothetical protein